MAQCLFVKHIRGSVFSVGIDYANSPHPDLPDASADALRIEQFFTDWGFKAVGDCRELSTASAREIEDVLERWSDSMRSSKLSVGMVLYVAGHGRLHIGRHYLLTASSPKVPPYFGSKAVSADDMASSLLNSGAPTGLIMLDTCYAGFAAQEIQQAIDRAAAAQSGAGMDLAVLVPSLHHQKSYSGLFVQGIIESLENGSRGGFWKDGDEFVTLLEIRDELRLRFADDQCAYVAGRDGLKVFPNPRYRADAADRSVEMGDLLCELSDADREHFLRKASSTDGGELGWFFAGRQHASKTIVEWIERADSGIIVVTGGPGTGKSALLGRLAVLADAGSQPACHALGLLDGDASARPKIDSFDAVVHLRNRRSDDVAIDIAAQLGVDLSYSSSPPRDLIAYLSDSGQRVTVLADALDEADHGEDVFIARDVLRAIASLPGCRVVVGTRRDKDGRYEAVEGDPGPLISTLKPRSGRLAIVDLDQDSDADEDIAHYVELRLGRSEVADKWPSEHLRRTAAQEISAQAHRIYLYARFAIRALEGLTESVLREPGWRTRLPSAAGVAGLRKVFALDLQRFEDPVMVQEILTPLAYARGKGLPRRQIWPELATVLALASSGRAYGPADISRVIRDAGWYLTEGTEDGQAVFRLYHESVAEYFRSLPVNSSME